MDAAIKAVQRALLARGYDIGPAKDDGKAGEMTWRAIAAAIDDTEEKEGIAIGYRVPLDWLQPVKMSRVILQWSAGATTASELDK